MIRLFLALLLFPFSVSADPARLVTKALNEHVLPGFASFALAADALAQVGQQTCDPTDADLRDSFHHAFDAWMAVSHLRFGPAETNGIGFAMAFWPDTRGATPKTLARLIAAEDPALRNPTEFSQISAAARGFFALEQMLYDPSLMEAAPEVARCDLLKAIAFDIGAMAADLNRGWWEHATLLQTPAPDARYQTHTEAAQALFKSLSEGLQFTQEARLGRPLGTFERPRPKRAEARRSGRSLRQVELSVFALKDLAVTLATDVGVRDKLTAAFEQVERTMEIDDPTFEGVATPIGRIKVEAIATALHEVRAIVALDLGPSLGVSAGFNSLDGD